ITVAGRSPKAAKVCLLSPLNGPLTTQSCPFMQIAAALKERGVGGLDLASPRFTSFETEVSWLPDCRNVTLSSEEPGGSVKLTGSSARCGFPSADTISQSIRLDPVLLAAKGNVTRRTLTPGISSYCLGSST